MAQVRIPRMSESRKERGFATLVRAVRANPTAFAFEGKLFKCGAAIDESALWPDDTWPRTPLLIEYAGPDYSASLAKLSSGWGGKRRPALHVLWRWEAETRVWRELARASTVDNDWIAHFSAIARVELARDPKPLARIEIAARASARWIDSLDRELAALADGERALALGYLYEELVARVAELGA